MKYLCLISFDERKLDALSKSELATLDEESLAYDQTLRKSGHFIAAQALESARAATTLRVRNGKVSVTDGAFAETKEQLAGFYLIEAPDLDGALSWAARCPGAAHGSIEVRPIWTT